MPDAFDDYANNRELGYENPLLTAKGGSMFSSGIKGLIITFLVSVAAIVVAHKFFLKK